MKKYYLLFLVLILTTGCAGYGGGLGIGTISKTNKLVPGMSVQEVKQILGDPGQSQFVKDKWVWKYTLHQPFVGFIPYYLVFNKDSQKLEMWFANKEEYYRQQNLWLGAIGNTYPQTQIPSTRRRKQVIIRRKSVNCEAQRVGNLIFPAGKDCK